MFSPKRKGFFPYLHVKLQESLSEEEKTRFAELETRKQRIEFLMQLPRLCQDDDEALNLLAFVTPMRGEKSEEKSEKNREAGNSAFHAGNFKQAQVIKIKAFL